ncbi:MAG: hypothetical protein H6Q55_2665 [Deltaproteobacteria bacterium]|nr:hypothetical protein [Deltaproteobacteria bacterium]
MNIRLHISVLVTALTAALFLMESPLPSHDTVSARAVAYAQDSWQKEFDDICSKTQDAMLFNVEELRNLIARCDALKPRIEKLEASERKVATKKLSVCRDLYEFVREAKEKR